MTNLINVEKNVLEDHGLLFLHIPKCGGRAIINNFVRYHNSIRNSELVESKEESGGTAHQPASLIYENDKYKHLDNFTFVRNPYERIASNYFWQIRPVGRKSLHPSSSRYVGLDFKSFYDFVMRLPELKINDEYESSQQGLLPYMFQPQTWWMNDRTVFVGKMENMHNDLNRLIQDRHISFPLFESSIENKHAQTLVGLNVKRKYFQIAYTQEMVDIINDLYREDFETFGYDMYDKTIKGVKKVSKTTEQVSDGTTIVSMADVSAVVGDAVRLQQEAFLKALGEVRDQVTTHLQVLYGRIAVLEEQILHTEE